MPRILFETGGKARIERDEFGNARGGIRLPDLEAPIGAHRGDNDQGAMASLSGETKPFSAEQIGALYPDKQTFVAACNRAVDVLAANGLVLTEDEPALRARAAVLPILSAARG
jgi:hypothetical protein